MTQDYGKGYNLNQLKTLFSFKGEVKKENFDEQVVKIFDFFDANKNGKIEKSELNELLGQVSSYGASADKSIFDTEETIQFISDYKNKENKTLKQLGITENDLHTFLDKIRKEVGINAAKTKYKHNLEINGIGNTYREIALWLCRQEQKNPSEAVVKQKEQELKELNKNANPPLVDGKLNGNYVKISVKSSGMKNVSKYIAQTMSNAIEGWQWNAGGIKNIQKKFDKGEINKYNIVDVLDSFNYKKDQYGNVKNETKLGDSSIIDAIISETEWGDNSNKIKLMTSIIDTLAQAARAVGLSDKVIAQQVKEFKAEMNRQMKFMQGTGAAPADAQKMENILETFIGIIKNPIEVKEVKPNYEQVKQFADENKTNVSGNVKASAYRTARVFYNIVDNNSGSESMAKLKALVNNPQKFNSKTIVDIVIAYNTTGIRKEDADFIDSILSESNDKSKPTVNHKNKTYIAQGEAYNIIYKITNLLKQAAREKGVPERFITQARMEWMREMYDLKENGSDRLKEHEIHSRYINKLVELAGGKTTGAKGSYDSARADDNIVGISMDWVLGKVLGCKTMADMESKLGSEAVNARKLVNIANQIQKAKTDEAKSELMAKFKDQYKAMFGVDYNPQLMAERAKLQERVAKIDVYDALEAFFNNALKQTDINGIKAELDKCKTIMGVGLDQKNIYLSEMVEEQVNLFMMGMKFAGKEISKEDAYKNILAEMKKQYKAEADKAKEGTTEEAMRVELAQLNQAVFGKENIGKEVAIFNQNQALVQQYSGLIIDIGVTIGTSFIPALGEVAGLKLMNTIANLAKSSSKLANLYKAVYSASNALYKTSKGVKSLQQGNAVGKIIYEGNKAIRTITVGSKTYKLGEVANLALSTTISGSYNAVTSGAAVTGLHMLEGENFEKSFEAGKGMAIFGMVSAAGSFAGKVASGIAGKMGCSLELAQKTLAFVIEQGSVFGFANYETVAAYVKERQKTDPDFSLSKLTAEEFWDIIVSDENLINNAIMLTMSIIPHINNMRTERELTSNLKKALGDSPEALARAKQFMKENPNVNKADFNNFVKKLDMKKIEELAPQVRSYTPQERELFIRMHYLMGTKEFNTSALTFDVNLTEFLSNEYLGNELNNIFTVFPLTSKYIGKLPQGWNTAGNTSVGGIHNAINEFRQRIYGCKEEYDYKMGNHFDKIRELDEAGKPMTIDELMEGRQKILDEERQAYQNIANSFAQEMKTILGKEVSVEYLGGGNNKHAFKVKVEGAEQVVLDIFNPEIYNEVQGSHGQWAEIQAGPYLNKNTDNYAWFHYGKLPTAHDNDGWMIIQFVDKKTQKRGNNPDNGKYTVGYTDHLDGNSYNGVIFDYGGATFQPQKGTKPFDVEAYMLKRKAKNNTNLIPEEARQRVRATSETNPGERVAEKVKKEWLEKDLETTVPEEKVDLYNLDQEAGLKNAPEGIYDEVTPLVLHNQLESFLTKKYETAREFIKDIISKNMNEIQQFAEMYKNNKEEFAYQFMHILSRETGTTDIEPLLIISNNRPDGLTTFEGVIQLPESLNTVSDVVSLLTHEFMHHLQNRDFIAQYREKGIRLLLEKNENLTPMQREEAYNNIIQKEYIQKILNSTKDANIQEGSLYSYLNKIQLEEQQQANIKNGQYDLDSYLNKRAELEAYYIGSSANGNLGNWNAPLKDLNLWGFLKNIVFGTK